MSKNNVRFRGVASLSAKFTRLKPQVGDTARGIVNETAELVFTDSQRDVPVDTGNLKASGRIEPAEGSEILARVSYGGTAAEYALAVHETHASKSKFLEAPARERHAQFMQDLRKALGQALK